MIQLSKDEECSLSSFAKHFNVTERTIRSDILKINKFLSENSISPILLEKSGYLKVKSDFVNFKQYINLQDYYSYKLTKEERIIIASIILISSVDYVTISDIADRLFVSRTTIINDLPSIKSFLQDFSFTLKSKPNKGFLIEGKEKDIRSAIINFSSSFNDKKEGHSFFKMLDMNSSYNYKYSNVVLGILDSVQKEKNIIFSNDALNSLHYYLNVMIERNLKGLYIENRLFKKDMPEEIYEFAFSIIHFISQFCNIEVHESEIHFLAGFIKEELPYTSNTVGMREAISIQVETKKLISIISKSIRIDLERDYQLYEKLSGHLISIYSDSISEEFDNPLLNDIYTNHHDLVKIIKNNIGDIEKLFGRKLNQTEILYIAIHFLASVERTKRNKKRIDVIIVCNSGIGTSQFVKAKLTSIFNINIVAAIASNELDSYRNELVDLIISTVPLENPVFDTINVSANLTDEDCARIGDKLCKIQNQKTPIGNSSHDNEINTSDIMKIIDPILLDLAPDKAEDLSYQIGQGLIPLFNVSENNAKQDCPYLYELIEPEFIELDVKCDTWQDAIKAAAKPLLDKNYIDKIYVDSIIDTTLKLGAYYVIAPGIAAPHAAIENGANKTGMSLVRLAKPIKFYCDKDATPEQKKPIKYIFMMCTSNENEHLLSFFHLLHLLHNTDLITKIDNTDSKEKINHLIQTYELEINDY